MSLTFPGLKANLAVRQQFSFEDKLDKGTLIAIMRFYNKNPDPESLINRVEVWQDRSGMSLVDVYFHASGCEKVREEFSNKIHCQSFHHHNYNWCKLQITNRNDMHNFLIGIVSTQTFADDHSQGVMKLILSKL